MTVFERASKKLLDLLPFDGDKAKLGSWSLIILAVQDYLNQPGLLDAIQAVFSSSEGLIAAAVTLLGFFHKQLKAKSK